jgi:hypothetical protein
MPGKRIIFVMRIGFSDTWKPRRPIARFKSDKNWCCTSAVDGSQRADEA